MLDLEPGQVGEVQREELFRFRQTLKTPATKDSRQP
jgi:hypothetical protein